MIISPVYNGRTKYSQRAELARSLAQPGHWWFWVYHTPSVGPNLQRRHVGNVPGKHYDGALARAIKIHSDVPPEELCVELIESIGQWDGQQCPINFPPKSQLSRTGKRARQST